MKPDKASLELVNNCTMTTSTLWLQVVVKPGKANAELYLDGKLTTEAQSMHYPKKAKGGIILANGFENRAHFRDLELY